MAQNDSAEKEFNRQMRGMVRDRILAAVGFVLFLIIIFSIAWWCGK